uniref:Carboxylesterase type B domain-containing protein n=1 Tax=Acrobeloides nanus TaxID=290746 RepID=A0A914CWV9_9BILA
VKSTTKYPVMVEIHGGGLITGSSRMWDNGIVRNFVSQGIVFVSIDYRMGWLGFFTTFTDDFPPNLGMLDQWGFEQDNDFGAISWWAFGISTYLFAVVTK